MCSKCNTILMYIEIVFVVYGNELSHAQLFLPFHMMCIVNRVDGLECY